MAGPGSVLLTSFFVPAAPHISWCDLHTLSRIKNLVGSPTMSSTLDQTGSLQLAVSPERPKDTYRVHVNDLPPLEMAVRPSPLAVSGNVVKASVASFDLKMPKYLTWDNKDLPHAGICTIVKLVKRSKQLSTLTLPETLEWNGNQIDNVK
ncbi:hypothetical protein DFH94DRAFT_683944 [Russula ochroleuca]|uniref:Uncharacterized protein n=1 Tax=Russula ochroleuca TaxID=152965 RepID=A0A9P5K2I6_9AGAM|nr:hypothetical protein DFH94DRAFT_683944 [Russula ochroleuca]